MPLAERASPIPNDASAAPPRLKALFAPLDRLLASGGDTRLAIEAASGLNGYGCRPSPRDEAFTFASSTASSISGRAFLRAGQARDQLCAATITHEGAIEARLEEQRIELVLALGLAGTGARAVLAPSGTDAQLHTLFVTHAILGGPLTSIIVAADETGSGSGLALTGKHFNTVSARGDALAKGAQVDGIADTARIDIPLTEESGRRRTPAEIDAAIIEAVAGCVRAGRKVLLQTMDRSKLWRRAPSRACLAEITARWPGAVQIIVDACQVRTSPGRLKAALGRGEMVLVTGSKFFTGPPFSGALLVPPVHHQAIAQARVPHGLRAYSHANDWPADWVALRAQLDDGFNVGQFLRWEAALAEIEAYRAIPQTVRDMALARFCERASRLIAETGFELLEDERPDSSDPDHDDEFIPRTILPFRMRRSGAHISLETAKGLYRALNCDVSAQLPPGASAEDKAIAAQLCHIGQPVAIRTPAGEDTAVLRISAGARILSDNWCDSQDTTMRNLDGEIEQVRRITAKLRLLLAHGITG